MRVGVLTGLAAEARLLARCASLGDRLLVHRTGADPARARIEAERLAAAGARALISFGLAGGIDPVRRPGDLIIADRVVLPGGRAIETDGGWRALLLASASTARVGAIAGTDRMLVSAADKGRLFAETGAAAADMESHVLAEAAERAGLPLLVVRAVGDPAWRNVASVALVPLRPDGTVRFGAVSLALCAKPLEWPGVFALARETRAGLLSLRRVAAALMVPQAV